MFRSTSHHDRENITNSSQNHRLGVVATILNGLIPGLGLAYMGRWAMAAANFVLAASVMFYCLLSGDAAIVEHVHWVILVLVVGSAAIAHGVANSSAGP